MKKLEEIEKLEKELYENALKSKEILETCLDNLNEEEIDKLKKEDDILDEEYFLKAKKLRSLKLNDKITKGNLYFKMGSGRNINSKYFITDDNEKKDNGFKENSYGILEIQTAKNNNFNIVFFEEDIAFFSSDNHEEQIKIIKLEEIIKLLND